MRSFVFMLLGCFMAMANAYECDGRTHCSQMHSCDEATWFLNHCPGTQMDGDNDGVPCERQWCGGGIPPASVNNGQARELPQGSTSTFNNTTPAEDVISRAFHDRSNNLQVIGSGSVEQMLSDDNEGGRHQRFVVRTDSGISVLIVHNIDLAPRVNSLQVGDKVTFYGVYVWNEKGGLVHWTHHDPKGAHAPGWIKYRGNKYQ